jgi:hypothetical protein
MRLLSFSAKKIIRPKSKIKRTAAFDKKAPPRRCFQAKNPPAWQKAKAAHKAAKAGRASR